MTTPPFDLFLAHASPDKAQAIELHTPLAALGLRPFLDQPDLPPGSAWDQELHEALLTSRLAAVLVGPSYDAAWYLRDEVAKLIALHRAHPQRVQVVPVFLQGVPFEAWRIPYGLSPLNSLDWPREGGAVGVARRLAGALGALSGAPPLAALPLAIAPPPALDRKKRLRVLRALLPAQFATMQFLSEAPSADLPPDTQPQGLRAIQLLLWLDAQGPTAQADFDAELRKMAPGLFA